MWTRTTLIVHVFGYCTPVLHLTGRTRTSPFARDGMGKDADLDAMEAPLLTTRGNFFFFFQRNPIERDEGHFFW